MGSKIDYGNRMLSLDLVPRDDIGVPINPKTAGVMQLYKVVSSLNISNELQRIAIGLKSL